MADQVVVVGRGKVLADATVEELVDRASGDQVLLRTPAPDEAAKALQRARAAATVIDRNTLSVTGIEAQRVVEILRPGGSRLLRGHRSAGEPGGRLPPTHRRRGRVPRRRRRAGGAMSATSAPPRPTDKPASNSFRSVLWAEWTKFRTVRGWIIALVLGAAATFSSATRRRPAPTPVAAPASQRVPYARVHHEPSCRPGPAAKGSLTPTSSSIAPSPVTAPSRPRSPRWRA